MHIAGSQSAQATLSPGTLPKPASFQRLQVAEELLGWHREELRDLPSEKHTRGNGEPVSTWSKGH